MRSARLKIREETRGFPARVSSARDKCVTISRRQQPGAASRRSASGGRMEPNAGHASGRTVLLALLPTGSFGPRRNRSGGCGARSPRPTQLRHPRPARRVSHGHSTWFTAQPFARSTARRHSSIFRSSFCATGRLPRSHRTESRVSWWFPDRARESLSQQTLWTKWTLWTLWTALRRSLT